MKKLILVLTAFLFLTGCLQLKALNYYNKTFVEKVVDVVDGQTIVTENQHKKRNTIVFYGIFAPKTFTPEGKKAKKFLSEMVLEKKIRFTVKGVDKNNQLLSVVYLEKEKETINAKLVKEGYAKIYSDGCKIPECSNWKKFEK